MNSLIGKKVRGLNSYGEAVGKLATIIDENQRDADRYGNYSITIEYEDGTTRKSRIFWYKIVEE